MIVASWLLKRFGMSVLLIVLSLTALLSMFDLLARASDVMEEAANPLLPLLYYWILRIPGLLVFVLPFAILVASLQTFARLASHQEIVALQTTSFSLYRVTTIFLAAALALGVAQFYFADRIVTRSVARLAEWKDDDYRGLPKLELSPEKPKWLSSGNYMVHMGDISEDGTLLQSPTLIWRNEKGATIRYLEAKQAHYTGHSWILTDAFERNLITGKSQQFDSLPVVIDLLPLHLAFLNRDAEVLCFSQLMILGSGQVETQLHPARYYLMAAWRRIAQPLGSAIMVLLAAPVALQLSRNGNRVFFTVFAMAMGFSYFIVESVLQTLGETAELAVLPAVWAPPALFAFIGLSTMIHQQK